MKTLVSPRMLYPTESVSFIEENKILFFVECFKANIPSEDIIVFLFNGNYHILKGHHKMLAANRIQLSQIEVDVTDIPKKVFFADYNNIEENFKAIGLRTLYDFEAIGGFEYSVYPEYYNEA